MKRPPAEIAVTLSGEPSDGTCRVTLMEGGPSYVLNSEQMRCMAQKLNMLADAVDRLAVRRADEQRAIPQGEHPHA